ncbi:protein of unknown function [Flavobacterium micromati]|uniref:GYF domain-containing protein n=1 Tax=Flavobacterium micromati TaxID=229205 RepID=A0A1M5JJQ0_9FLAO|nr:DUF4339 domain-containing protein [Flavobacterium micromati]SHG40489.1 protein of unknown function [Flavobacterium micromati]
MNSYFIHNGTESSGPFTLLELKAKEIVKTTPVWCEGMQDWKYAADVAELQSLLGVVPPPIKILQPVFNEEIKVLEELEHEESKSKIIGIDKTLFFILCALLFLVIGTFVFTFFQDSRSAELEQKNSVTEKDNLQFKLQEKRIEEQKSLLIEQEKLEIERELREKKLILNNNLIGIQENLFVKVSALDQTKDKLAKAQDFQFLRTDAEREAEINNIQNEIKNLNNEIIQLKTEMDHIYLELEKIKL